MQRTLSVLAICGVLLSACSEAQPTQVDVTPTLTATGGMARLPRVRPTYFDGRPTRIGFEPLPLTGGDFPALTSFAFLPDSDEFLALNRFGKVGHFRLERDKAIVLGSFQIPAVYTKGECIASTIELDPDFRMNKLFYVGYCIDAQYSVIKRYAMSQPDFGQSLYTAANILAMGDPKAVDAQNAIIGTLAFADGVMWASVGDRRREQNAQDMTNELGKILRFSPIKDANSNGYTVVQGNVFFGKPPNSSLVYASGLRNPWRGAFDRLGRYWVADGAAGQYEEVNMVTKAGENFGWPMSEGDLCKRPPCDAFVKPMRHWDQSESHPYIKADPLAKISSQFRAAWVGGEYIPEGVDRYKGLLTGKVLYGDFYVGFVRGITVNAQGEVVADEHLGHIELPVAWRRGRDGYLYVGTMFQSFDRSRENEGGRSLLSQAGQGSLWRVVPLP